MSRQTRHIFIPATRARIVRAEEGKAEAPKLIGYGAVFYNPDVAGTEYRLWDDLVERIAPGAFDDLLESDVRGLMNHDMNLLLGRVPATMRLSVDKVGLRYEIDLPDTQAGRDAMELVERGDLDGSSFSFDLDGGSVRYEYFEDSPSVRMIEKVGTLYDVGPVTFPAYEATTAEARSSVREEFDAWKRDRDPDDDTNEQEHTEDKATGDNSEDAPTMSDAQRVERDMKFMEIELDK